MQFLPTDISGSTPYAGFLKRTGAMLVDGVVSTFALLAFAMSTGHLIISIPLVIWANVMYFAIWPVYTIYFHNRFGATPGKMMVGIKVTLPDGSAIGLRQAFLRSSVDIMYQALRCFAMVVAIPNVDPEQYLAAAFWERDVLAGPFLPAWYGFADTFAALWILSEIVVILFNRRRRAIHDYIAGTVVIHREYAKQTLSPSSQQPTQG